MKRLLYILLSLCICAAALPICANASETELTADNIDALIDTVAVNYSFSNSDTEDAQGNISLDFGSLPQESVTSVKYYWVDSEGAPLSGYSYITEFSASAGSYNTVSAAADGYAYGAGTVIPYGAAGIIAKLCVTLSDASTVEKTVDNCNYIIKTDGIASIYSSLPEQKTATVDYTADIGGKEQYQLFYISDFHNHYGWNPNNETDPAYNTVKYTYISSDAKKGSPQGKALYAVNKILGSDSKSIGTINAGDIINDKSDGSGNNGLAAQGSYTAVLATYYQAGLTDYLNFFTNGNHDLIKSYATEENNQYIDFTELVNAENNASAQNYDVSGLPNEASYYYDFYIGDDHYIVLSSPYDGGYYGDEQLAWAEALLKADNEGGVRTFIVNHEPMTGTGLYTTQEYMTDAPKLKSIIEDNSANHETVWFSGHTHITYYNNVKNVSLYGTENVAYVGLPYIWDTGKKDIAQGLQVKVYEDKVVMIGRLLYASGAYSTDILPSAVYVLDFNRAVDSTIEISSAQELCNIGKISSMPLDGDYKLTADIDLSDTDFEPIGYSSGDSGANKAADVFTGTFDGNGHTVSGISCSVEGGTYLYAGLFGVLNSATVKNLRIADSTFSAYGGSNFTCAGAVAGATVSTANPSPYSTVISNVSVENCSISATVTNTGNPAGAGGLVGYSESGVSIYNCYVAARVKASIGGSASGVSRQIAAGGLAALSWNGKVYAEDCVIKGSINAEGYYSDGSDTDAHCPRQNSVLALNTRGIDSTTYDTTGVAEAVSCYYISVLGSNSANPRGLDGTAKTATELIFCDVSEMGLDSAYWYNNGMGPRLRITGSDTLIAGDANGDRKNNIIDLIRMKKHIAGTASADMKACDFNSDGTLAAYDLATQKSLLLLG